MNESLIAAIERAESLADDGDIDEERTRALEYYRGDPLGNEVQGRSQVVSRDVWDTVEWIKPQLADIFCSGDQVVQFSPNGPEDTLAAQQETEYVNWVATQKNSWFTTFYNWSHDALLQKVGYVIAHYDDGEDRTKEQYAGLTDDELALLLQDPEIQVSKHEATEQGHSVTVERVKQYGCVKIENIAPERVRVSRNARGLDLQDPRLDFCEYFEFKTISELRDDGFEVDDNLSDHSDGANEWDEVIREDGRQQNIEGEESSPAARRLKVRNVWIRYDADDDGRTELRKCIVVGKTILNGEDGEECDLVTLVAMCPVPMPHTHKGMSIADAVMDLQRIKTALLRGSLDNLYLASNGRHVIDEEAINMDDMLVSRPGGLVRKKAGIPMADAIMPLLHSTTGDVAIPMMEYIDRIGQKRTGVNEQSQGLDPNALNKTAMGANIMMNAAQQRIKFVARIFAETGVKALFLVIHALSLKHARKAEIIQIRSQWVPVDPRQWKKRTEMSVAVGLGSGDRPQQIAMLTQILGIQAQAAPQGLATAANVYNTLKRLVQAAGYKDPTEFWTDPTQNPPPPPMPPPELLKEQARAQAMQAIEQMKIGAEVQLKREEFGLKMQELQANLQLQASNDQRDAERERMRAEFQAQLDMQKLENERLTAELAARTTLEKTDRDNATKLLIAGQQAEQAQGSEAMRMAHEAQQTSEAREAERNQDVTKEEAEKLIGQSLAGVQKQGQQMADMLQQLAASQQALEKAVKAKRVLVRGPDGKPSHSEVVE